jgi:predicted nucleic acid-binding protein
MRRSTRPSIANEILADTSGFFALIDERDVMHDKARAWIEAQRWRIRPVSTEWVVGEIWTLLVARKRPHLVARFLDYVDSSAALLLVNPDDTLLRAAKAMIRQQAEQSYSFVDCISFCLMKERGIRKALTTDSHYHKAGFAAVLI